MVVEGPLLLMEEGGRSFGCFLCLISDQPALFASLVLWVLSRLPDTISLGALDLPPPTLLRFDTSYKLVIWTLPAKWLCLL